MLILSFSGNAENSLTLKSLEVLEHHPDVTDEFEKVLVKPSAKTDDGECFAGLRAKTNARPAMPDTYKIGAKMRLIPCEKVIESLDRRKTKA